MGSPRKAFFQSGTSPGDVRISQDEFRILSEFIYRKCGIRFEPQKLYFISKRINKRMRELAIATVADYIRLLRFQDLKGQEFQRLVNLLTVNETYLFRDFPQLQAFGENCLEDVENRKIAAGDRTLKIWSAACSTGEEPYTLAIILLAMLDDPEDFKIEIVASDIDENVLKKAQNGVYYQRSIRDVPKEYLMKYFTRSRSGAYTVSDQLKELVHFEHLNLNDKDTVRKKRGFDFIFCRNLLIYFDDDSRKRLMNQFYISLNKGGYIFLGSSESVSRLSAAFKMKRMGKHLVYYK
ncbi:CheR family methyltransferase [Desulfobacter latus]|uniref:protein-glutamate O-methyltransferase n=1 Tax=Desulfobacter latus TaxID=2292 RepID=A0A850T6Y7_9BACT|nr:protein-glutamate O-methyltransferase CheR [Desulfobacter latus]NWH05162.1 protein-glutamate O-methyltransferase CheR [Desulfobacter latus]